MGQPVDTDGQKPSRSAISLSAVLQVLVGVGVATETSAEVKDLTTRWASIYLSPKHNTHSDATNSDYSQDDIALARSLREWGDNVRMSHQATEDDLSYAWALIHGTLTNTERVQCIVTQDGFVLAGQEKEISYRINSNPIPTNATHALYELSGLDKYGTGIRTGYGTSIVNTGKLILLDQTASAVRIRNMSYDIPSGVFHTIEVEPDKLHATLVFSDASRGSDKHASFAGPKDLKSYTPSHDPKVGMTARHLVELVHLVREWETQMAQGQKYTHTADWENSLRYFNTALKLCDHFETFRLPNRSHYRQSVLGKIGGAYRRFGRYEQAEHFLKRALEIRKEASPLYVDITGELSVVYRSMNLLDAAKEAVELQYATAKDLNLEREELRAVGNLGMINYQLFLNNGDQELLKLAIEQLHERIRIARHMRAIARSKDSSTNADNIRYAFISEAIAFARLSLCFTSSGDLAKAIEAGSSSLEISLAEDEPFLIAMARFFYGRALLKNGQSHEAKQQFTWPDERLTPAMAFCGGPSDEHRGYLRELVETGVDMSRADENGYTALDYAVFSDDAESTTMSSVEAQKSINALHQESKLRKSYRQLFQENLRLALLHSNGSEGLTTLRKIYAQALAADAEKRSHFDAFKAIPYKDFAQHKRLPHSKENLAREYSPSDDSRDFVLFFSYRWVKDESGISRPDDKNHTGYKRMIAAVEQFLHLHPSVDRERLGIWLDVACINQDETSSGVAALPINLAQCNTVISLVEGDYHKRAWCSVEVLMVQTLKRACGLHLWYQHVTTELDEGQQRQNKTQYTLREGPMELEVVVGDKELTYEGDRPKVLFLERQTKLLA
ncbi:hypothetical protein F5B21DRAFT_529126 [Xylaria acuta]|nr:hypothetical protein F5B21DRAFT_529126 [Xylaria acuta]